MSTSHQPITHSVDSSNLADLLERILDKGVVVAGDISIKLVEVELLTIQLRLVICSVDKARELGLDWWNQNNARLGTADSEAKLGAIERRMERLEEALCALATAPGKPEGAHP